MIERAPQGTSSGSDTDVAEILGLVEALIRVIDEENRQLATGLPASLSSAVADKGKLAVNLEAQVAAIRSQTISIADAAPLLRQQLAARSSVLSDAMVENTTRLRAAIEATRRRIEAVMRAVRDDATSNGAYNAGGTRDRQVRPPEGNAGYWV